MNAMPPNTSHYKTRQPAAQPSAETKAELPRQTPRQTPRKRLLISLLALVFICMAHPARTQTSPQAATEGRRLYLKLNCYSCHGVHAQGTIGPNIQQVDIVNTTEALVNGAPGGMRSFSTYLTTAQIADIAAYLAVAGTSQEPTFLIWWKP